MYQEWRANPNARRFKRVGEDVSVRIDPNYRAMGYVDGDTVWVGKHDDYDRLLGSSVCQHSLIGIFQFQDGFFTE